MTGLIIIFAYITAQISSLILCLLFVCLLAIVEAAAQTRLRRRLIFTTSLSLFFFSQLPFLCKMNKILLFIVFWFVQFDSVAMSALKSILKQVQYSNYMIWPKVCGHLTITAICRYSQNYCHKGGSTQLHRIVVYGGPRSDPLEHVAYFRM